MKSSALSKVAVVKYYTLILNYTELLSITCSLCQVLDLSVCMGYFFRVLFLGFTHELQELIIDIINH